MPKSLDEDKLEGQVEMQADQYIPFPMEEVSYDYQVVGPSEKDPEMLDVLLVATRTENVEQRQAAVQASGLTAYIVDVEAFALENACALMRHQMPDGGLDRTVAVVDFGASSTTFSVLRDMKVIYTRDFAFGGQQLTEEIMRTYGLSMEEAGRAKKEGGLPSNYQPEVLDPFIDDMTQQVSRSLQFYLASGSGRSRLRRRSPPVFQRRRLSATVRSEMGLRKSIQGSYAPLGVTQTSGNSCSAFLGRSPPRKLK